MPTPLGLHVVTRPWRACCPKPHTGDSGNPPRKLLLVSLTLSLICVSCAAVGSGPAATPACTVDVSPSSAQPFTDGSVQFKAVVENASNSGVLWQVNGMAGGDAVHGTIDPNGRYTAPASVPNPQTVTVTAALQSDSAISGSSSVTILSLSSVTGSLAVSPPLSSVTTSQTLQFNVLTPGIGNMDVAWAVTRAGGDGSSGTITLSGLYTPPSTAGTDTITAKLPNAVGSATVEVTDFPGNLTWRNDNSRSGVNSRELALAPSTVSSTTFGKLFSCSIDGYAYAQPLYVPNLSISGKGTHNVVIVATEKDSVFAFDADASPCDLLWQTSLVPQGSQPIATPNLQMGDTNIVPFIGITGTPAIGENPLTLYVAAASQTVAMNPVFSEQLHALDLTAVPPPEQSSGIEIQSPNSPIPSFQPMLESQRPALLLDNGAVYVGFGSYGGVNQYFGWLFAYDATSLQQTGIFNPAARGNLGGGIWQSGGGPSADLEHNVFVATGDGPQNTGASHVDSIIRLETSGGLSVADFFTPCDQVLSSSANPQAALLSESSAPVLLPDSAGSPAQPHLLLGGSKEGYLYVVNRDDMGQFQPEPCPDVPPRVQAVQTGGPILSTPLFWSDSTNSSVFVAPGNGKLLSFSMSGGVLSSTPAALQSPETLGPQGATPVLSANGTSNAILWLIDTSGAMATPAAPAILRAYDAENLSNEVYNSAMVPQRDTAGLAVKFTVPTVANGKVYVGTQTELDVYGLLP